MDVLFRCCVVSMLTTGPQIFDQFQKQEFRNSYLATEIRPVGENARRSLGDGGGVVSMLTTGPQIFDQFQK